jgi:hypothetical protein
MILPYFANIYQPPILICTHLIGHLIDLVNKRHPYYSKPTASMSYHLAMGQAIALSLE